MTHLQFLFVLTLASFSEGSLSDWGIWKGGAELSKAFVGKVGMVREALPCWSSLLSYDSNIVHDQITKDGIGLQYGLLAHAPDEDFFLLVTHSSLQRFVTRDHTTKGFIEIQ